jgi:hypothetical protein
MIQRVGIETRGSSLGLFQAASPEVRAACLDFSRGQAWAVITYWGLLVVWFTALALTFVWWWGFDLVVLVVTVVLIPLAWVTAMTVCDRVRSEGPPTAAEWVTCTRVGHLLFGSPWNSRSLRVALGRVQR